MTNYFSDFFHSALRDNFCQNEIDSITVFVSWFLFISNFKLKEKDKKLLTMEKQS